MKPSHLFVLGSLLVSAVACTDEEPDNGGNAGSANCVTDSGISGGGGSGGGSSGGSSGGSVPLEEAKLNIEFNSTDMDTGFQGALDSEDGWQRLDMTGPDGVVLTLEGKGKLGELGLTELFFETVEPATSDVPIEDVLARLPAGDYTISGQSPDGTPTSGTALLTHDIPAGPEILEPADGDTVPVADLQVSWNTVTTTITGDTIEIARYQLTIEKDEPPDPNIIGTGLSIYFPASVTSVTVPKEFLEPGADYSLEVLAIEPSGNQTITSIGFTTE